MKKTILALSLAMGAIAATPVFAADAASPAPAAAPVDVPAVVPATTQADNVQILLDKVKADKKLITAAALDLTDAEAKAFWPVYNQYQEGLAKVNRRLAKLVLDYAAAYN